MHGIMSVGAFIGSTPGHTSKDCMKDPGDRPIYCSSGSRSVIGADVITTIVCHPSKHISPQGIQSHDAGLGLRFTAIQASGRCINRQYLAQYDSQAKKECLH